MELKDYKAILRKNHFCARCRTQDAYTIAGHYYCAECSEKNKESLKKYRQDPEKYSAMKAKSKERYDRLKSAVLCVTCGQPSGGKTYCDKCRVKLNAARKRSKAKHGTATRVPGFCYHCKDVPCVEGKKLCKDCYDKQLTVIAHCNEVNRERYKKRALERQNKKKALKELVGVADKQNACKVDSISDK